MNEPEGPCPRCDRAHWEPLPFATADGRTHRCSHCWLTGPGWCPDCLDRSSRGWVVDQATNTARWCDRCGGSRKFRWGKQQDEDDDQAPEKHQDHDDRGSGPGAYARGDGRKDLDRLADGSWPAKWRKLRKSDEWGALAFTAKVEAGDELTIQRAKDSTTTVRTVRDVAWSGDGIALCELEPDDNW